MRNIYTIFAVTAIIAMTTGIANAIEIQIIDKTYNENTIRAGSTLQSDLDNAEQRNVPYNTQPKKVYTPPITKPVVKAPVKERTYDEDPVYTVPVEKPVKTLKDDIDNGAVMPKVKPQPTPVEIEPMNPAEVQSLQQELDAKPVPPAMPDPVVQSTKPAPIAKQKTIAPSVREPILLDNMSDEELKKQLGIDEMNAQPPMESTIEPQAGIEENFVDDAGIITAPPADALTPIDLTTTVE